jgi:trehalose-6-phosphatase
MSTLKVLWQMPETKAQIKTFVTSIKDEILDSGDEALLVLKQLKMVEKTLQAVLSDKEIDTHFLDVANKYHKDELVELYGARFEIKDVGVKYDYSNCDDVVLESLEQQKAKLDKEIKERQATLKSIKPGMSAFDNDTGIELKPPVRSAKIKVVVTL